MYMPGCDIPCTHTDTQTTQTDTHRHTNNTGRPNTLVLGPWGPGEAGGLPGGSLVLGLDGGDPGDRLQETQSLRSSGCPDL